MSGHRNRRGIRGVLLALCSAGLAMSAHALADGGPPDTAVTLVLTVLTGWVGAAVAEKAKGPLGVLAVLGTAQLAMHVVLSGLMTNPVPSPGMLLTHTAATFGTAVLLVHAESMVLAALASLGRLLPVVWHAAPVVTLGVALPVRPAPERPLITMLVRRVHGRRGPPLHS